MKAISVTQFGGPEVLKISNWPDPEPQPDEILVKIQATALNRADTMQRKGMYPPPPGESTILGLEMAGQVVTLGAHVDKWKIGDRVSGLLASGGYAEYVCIHQDMAIPIPSDWSFEEAAAVPEVFLTAFQALIWLAKIQPQEKIMIHAGASGVGTAAIQLARLKQASSLVTASAAKHQTCLDLGAEYAIEYKTQDFEQEVLSLTGQQGVDVILDFIGAPYFQKNLNILKPDGRLIQLAFMGGVKVPEVSIVPILRKRLQIIGSTLRARSLDYKIKLTRDFLDQFWKSFERKEIKPIVDSVFDWTNAAKAHEYMEANKNQGKIILKIS